MWELTVVWHGQDRDLSDRTIPSLYTTCALVQRGQIGIQVAWITSTTWHFFAGSRHLSQCIRITDNISALQMSLAEMPTWTCRS